MTIESIFEQIRVAGYNYAKEYYEKWSEYFMDDYDEDSWYKASLNENGCPKEEFFSAQMIEQCSHLYYSGSDDDFYKEFNITISASIAKEMEDEDLSLILLKGVDSFIEETYHHA